MICSRPTVDLSSSTCVRRTSQEEHEKHTLVFRRICFMFEVNRRVRLSSDIHFSIIAAGVGVNDWLSFEYLN